MVNVEFVAIAAFAVVLVLGSFRELWLKHAWLKVTVVIDDLTSTTSTSSTKNLFLSAATGGVATTTGAGQQAVGTPTPAAIHRSLALLIALPANASLENQAVLETVIVSAARGLQYLHVEPDVFLLVADVRAVSVAARNKLANHGVQLFAGSVPRIQIDARVDGEFLRLSAFKMVAYKRVVVLEPRVLLQGSLRELIEMPPSVELAYVSARNKPVETAFLVIVPSLDTFGAFERERGWLSATPDLAHFIAWFYSNKRPMRASVVLSDCHYANHEPAWCGDTPANQVSAFLFTAACPGGEVDCISADAMQAGGDGCTHARFLWFDTASSVLGRALPTCAR